MNKQTIYLGGGCFWCIEAIFKRIKGVLKVTSGYAGGEVADPNYIMVCSGNTGHAEVVKVEFDADLISLTNILAVFFKAHDPTTINRQGADIGTQYRSIILCENEEQFELVSNFVKELNDSAAYEDPIITEIDLLEEFYGAEAEHQDFYDQNQNYPYCRVVIDPKLNKLFED